QLRDDLFGLVLLLGHSNVLSIGQIAYFREDHFSGGRPSPRGGAAPLQRFILKRIRPMKAPVSATIRGSENHSASVLIE
ncbi:hypothetical protein, partial [Neoaquamicrobium microcysteis]|uniref:hypothetical protein n=1 Tax=Neoaquamicrobium microcysteis TaxID=2682781 RepID=UPI001AED7179